MEFQLELRDSVWCAAGEMTIYHANAMAAQLFAASSTNAPCGTLDLSLVTELDTCGLQMLLLLRRVRPGVEFAQPSPAVHEVLELCGLESLCSASEKAA